MLVWEESGGPEESGAEGVRTAGEKPGGGGTYATMLNILQS